MVILHISIVINMKIASSLMNNLLAISGTAATARNVCITADNFAYHSHLVRELWPYCMGED
jgi:hypothetical protein